jgi:antitoxin component YwqK of YwqJK toxin-antitoxin module
MGIVKVEASELGYESEAFRTFNGGPFSGVAVEKDARGKVVAETCYVDGVREGYTRLWDSAGNLKQEAFFSDGALHGLLRAWHANGNVAELATYELDICLSSDTFSETGELMESHRLTESDPPFQLLVKRRCSRRRQLARKE